MSTGLVWFRNDLRVKDQESLALATNSHKNVIGVYCFDPRQFKLNKFGFKKTEKYRAKFLIETVEDLKSTLEKYTIPLFVYLGKPEDYIPKLLVVHKISHIYFQDEWTKEERVVEEALKEATKTNKVNFVKAYSQFLFSPNLMPFQFSETPKVFTVFRKWIEKEVQPRSLVIIKQNFEQKKIDNPTTIPSIKDLGFENFSTPVHTAFPFRGGEANALEHLTNYFWKTEQVSYYKKTRNGLLGTKYSSKLSAWLANGSISANTIYNQLKKYEQQVTKNESTYWLFFELLWRDYFKYISLRYGDAIFKQKGIKNSVYNWQNNSELVEQWITGTTQSNFVNANMIELQQTGWMSNRGRQNVASYFAKNLQLDWRIGAAYFESLLIDYDVHSNYGNWCYVAGVGNDPRDRTFNVDLQAKRYDPNAKYQKLWLQPKLF